MLRLSLTALEETDSLSVELEGLTAMRLRKAAVDDCEMALCLELRRDLRSETAPSSQRSS